MICDFCGRIIDCKYKRADGLAAGFDCQLRGGKIVTVCTDCFMKFAEHPANLAHFVIKIYNPAK